MKCAPDRGEYRQAAGVAPGKPDLGDRGSKASNQFQFVVADRHQINHGRLARTGDAARGFRYFYFVVV